MILIADAGATNTRWRAIDAQGRVTKARTGGVNVASIARATVEERITQALSELKDYPLVAVWVLEGTARAIRFYEKCGFRRDGKEQELMLGTKVKEVRMVKRPENE